MGTRQVGVAPTNPLDATTKAYVDGQFVDRYRSWGSPQGGGSTNFTNMNLGPTAVGTATGIGLDTTTEFGMVRKLAYRVTTASTTAITSVRSNQTLARGSAGVPGCGFSTVMKAGPDLGVATMSTHRFFMGLRGSTSAPTDVNPSTLTNIIGIGYDATDTQLQLMHNDASGTAVKTALGTDFPKPTVNSQTLYDFRMQAPAGSSTINWQLREVYTNKSASGTISSADIPAATTLLALCIWHSTNAVSSQSGIALGVQSLDALS